MNHGFASRRHPLWEWAERW